MLKNKFIVLSLVLIASATLADDVPPKKKLTLQDLINQHTGSPSTSPSVAGVRGLEETNGPIDTKARDYASLEKLERVIIHDDELKKFIDEGKLQ